MFGFLRNVKQIRLFELVLVVLVSGLLQACAVNPVSQAETAPQKALAVYGSLVIGVEQIAALVAPDTLPDNVQSRLIAVGERAGALAKAGLRAYTEVEAARAAFVADSSQQGRLSAALNSLSQWVTQAEPVVSELRGAIRGAQ